MGIIADLLDDTRATIGIVFMVVFLAMFGVASATMPGGALAQSMINAVIAGMFIVLGAASVGGLIYIVEMLLESLDQSNGMM